MMNTFKITLKEGAYILSTLVAWVSLYYQLDNRTTTLEHEMEQHRRTLERYQPAVMDVQLKNIQQDVLEIKELLKQMQHDKPTD